MKRLKIKIGFIFVFLLCLGISVLLPELVNRMYDRSAMGKTLYPDEAQAAELIAKVELGYGAEEVLWALDDIYREEYSTSDIYQQFLGLSALDNENDAEAYGFEAEAGEEANVSETEVRANAPDPVEIWEMIGGNQMAYLMTMDASEFLQNYPNAMETIKKQWSDYMTDGPIELSELYIAQENLMSVELTYIYNREFDDGETMGAILWRMLFTNSGGYVQLLVNSDDYTVLGISCYGYNYEYGDYDNDFQYFGEPFYYESRWQTKEAQERSREKLKDNLGISSVDVAGDENVFTPVSREWEYGKIRDILWAGNLIGHNQDRKEIPFVYCASFMESGDFYYGFGPLCALYVLGEIMNY